MSAIKPLTHVPSQLPARSREDKRRFSAAALRRGPYPYLILVALLLAGLSMLSKSTPSYDPWAWLIWGREILHGTLSTHDGPTWKPLPVVFTTIFALFGGLQPYLWLFLARCGFILSVLLGFKIAARLVAQMQPEIAHGRPVAMQILQFAPAVLAGLVAAGSIAFYGGYASDSALGYSEGVAVAFMLLAFDRALDGHHRQAFVAGLVVAWDRPESWAVWGPYGLWLMWRDAGARRLVIGLALLTLLVWFVPQKLGGGSVTSGVSRAHHPRSNSAAFASNPFLQEFHYHALQSVYQRAKWVALLGVLASIALALRNLRVGNLRHGSHDRRQQAVLLTGLIGVTGVAWWALISLETQLGFSGNDRYLVFGSVLVMMCAGCTLGWATIELTRLVRRWGASAAPAATAVVTLVALLYAFLPSGWVGNEMLSIANLRYQLHHQASLRIGFETLINRAGGHQAVNACGRVMVEDFQVPMAAWYLHLRIDQVEAQPRVNAIGEDPVKNGHWPATVFQDRSSPHATLFPLTSTIEGWEQQGADYKTTGTGAVTMFQDCAT